MKKSLMATVAAVALLGGTNLALSEGTSPGSEQRGPAAGQSQQPSAQPRGAEQRDRREPRSTTGQGTQDQPQQRPSAQQPGAQPRTGGQDRTQDRVQDRDRGAPGTGAQTETRDRSGPKSLTAEQKTKIRTTVISRGPKVSNVNFSINVGTVVPRSVRVVAVPPTLIEIYPEWRGYMYFVVGDEIVIVEPGTLRIIAVLDV